MRQAILPLLPLLLPLLLPVSPVPTPEPCDDPTATRDLVRRARLDSPSLALELRGADFAAAAGDTDDEARLLGLAAKEAPELLSSVDRLVLARQAEARGDRREAILQYGHVLTALQRRGLTGADWVGETIRRLDAEEEARRLPARPGFAPPNSDARRAFAEGKAALRRGANEPAREAFRRALRLSPGYSEAALSLGSVEERDGRAVEAAAAYRTALAADPDGFEALLALSNLQWNEPDRAAKEESLALLDRAAALRPGLARLHHEAANRWAAWGDPARALERLETWWPLASPEDRAAAAPFRDRLRARLARPGGPEASGGSGSDPASPAVGAFRVAQVYASRPNERDWDAAESGLEEAERLDPRFVPALELRAALRERRGDVAGAEVVLRRAVSVDPARAPAWERLAELLARQSARADEAEEAWGRAEQAGSREAIYSLARIASGQGRTLRAAALYRRYLAEAAGGVHAEEARAALEREKRRQDTLGGAAIGAVLFALVAGGLAWARRRSGLTLGAWLRRDPGATRDARSLAGRLSHEAFKHGGLLLGEALERLDTPGGLFEAAPLLVERLYGRDGAPGLVSEARTALAELEGLALRRGARLNLRFKDPVLSPVWRALDSLARSEHAFFRLAREGGLPERRMKALTDTLHSAAAVLSPRTAQLVMTALDEAGSTEVRFDRLETLLASVARESNSLPPRLAGLGLFASEPRTRVRVRVPEGDWLTLWRNLFANAVGAPCLALLAEERRDPVTGQALARFVLYDGDPRLLTMEMIRGRGAERGLGVVADLVRRWDGLVDVTPGTGEFTKGVALEFAAVERIAAEEAV